MHAIHHNSLRERKRGLSGEETCWYEGQKFLHVIEVEKVELETCLKRLVARRSLKNNLDYMGNVYNVLCLT